MVELAKASGFMLSADALKTAQEEVTEEELESVGGGTCSSLWLGFMWVAAEK